MTLMLILASALLRLFTTKIYQLGAYLASNINNAKYGNGKSPWKKKSVLKYVCVMFSQVSYSSVL